MFVATASLLVMFYYSEAASRYTRIGLNYIEVFRSKLTYVGSRTRERSWMITNNTSQWDELILNSSTHDPYTSESLISTSSFAPEANWTTDRDKLTEESTQQVITKRNVQEETKSLSTTSSEIQQAKELCPSGSKQGLYKFVSLPVYEPAFCLHNVTWYLKAGQFALNCINLTCYAPYGKF